MKYLKYFLYVLEHKWNVLIECWKEGLYWHGITHDLSKFRPSEFIPYAKYFYGGKKNKAEFEDAWKLHYQRNKHHWNNWVYLEYQDETIYCPEPIKKAKPMPEKYIKQMLCDWRGMSRKFGDTAQEYYLSHEDEIFLHPQTAHSVKTYLGLYDKYAGI